ncbi:MAG: tRNA (adenosine(37)-N6)-threonylcarbamoyltransferase complex transferase subunit TsaD [Acidimicrobiales bacterium]
MRVLGIETSCDETGAAVLSSGWHVESSVVESSMALHRDFGGVVPELAGRAHVETIGPTVQAALARAGLDERAPQLDAIAVTTGPGLVGSLLVGLAAAKAYALAWDVPLVAVNHLEGHLYAPLLESPDLAWPLLTLLVSGGHTQLVLVEAPGRFVVLGETIDDAAGEAYDKVARWLGLGYPGGPPIDRLAGSGDPSSLALPVSMTGEGLDFSFSGLKSAVVRAGERHPVAAADVAAAFQAAVVEQLTRKLVQALARHRVAGVALAGGVAANGALRAATAAIAAEHGIAAHLPSPAYCTDNGAMIAAAGLVHLAAGDVAGLDGGVDPTWALGA